MCYLWCIPFRVFPDMKISCAAIKKKSSINIARKLLSRLICPIVIYNICISIHVYHHIITKTNTNGGCRDYHLKKIWKMWKNEPALLFKVHVVCNNTCIDIEFFDFWRLKLVFILDKCRSDWKKTPQFKMYLWS